MDKAQLQAQMQELLAQKNGWELEPLAKQAVELFPEDNSSFYYLAEAQLLNWNYTEAQVSLKKLIALEPNAVEHKLQLGLAQKQAGEYEPAVETYKQILAENADNIAATSGLADVLMMLWRNEEALPLLNKALAADATNDYVRLLRARAQISLQAYDKALADAELVKNETYIESAVLVQLDAYKCKEDIEKTIEMYQKLGTLYPENTSHQANMASYLDMMGRAEDAIAQYGKVIEKEQEMGWDASYQIKSRAQVFIKMARYADAMADLNMILEKNAENAEVLALRAEVEMALGNNDAALQDIAAALQVEGPEGFMRNSYLKKRGDILLGMKRLDEAMLDFEAIAKDDFHAGEGFYGMGMVAKEKGDLKMAYEYWSKAKEKHHFEAENAINTYCQSIKEEGDNARAAELEQQFAPEFAKNAASPFLQPIFGKIWRVDKDKTAAAMPQLAALPEGMRDMILSAFELISMTITNQGLFIDNPSKDDIKAFYKIEEEGPGYVKLYGVPTNGKEPKVLQFSKEGDFLLLDMGTPDGSKLYMLESNLAEMSEEQRKSFEEKLKAMAMQFLGAMVEGIKEAFGK